MKQDTNDVVIKIITEWNQYEARMNYDTSGDELVRVFASMMKAMTFTNSTIIDSLRAVADEYEGEIKYYNEINKDEDYGTTDKEGTDY